MTTVHVLTIVDDEQVVVAQGAYRSDVDARQALVDFVANSPFDPTGQKLLGEDECPEDWFLEPTAFVAAVLQLTAASKLEYHIEALVIGASIEAKAPYVLEDTA